MAHHDLLAHRPQFEKSITSLGDGIYTAVGYAASNVHMIEGERSITIIDTSESTKAAEKILAEFQKLSDKPIARIIYTHSHRDHISGATVFAQERDVPILAHHGFKSDLVAVSDDVPAGVYEGQKNDGPVMSFDTAVGIAVRADMDEDTVYQVTKAFWDNIDQVTSEAPWAKALNLEFAASKRGLAELHPGAARYYREVGVLK